MVEIWPGHDLFGHDQPKIETCISCYVLMVNYFVVIVDWDGESSSSYMTLHKMCDRRFVIFERFLPMWVYSILSIMHQYQKYACS